MVKLGCLEPSWESRERLREKGGKNVGADRVMGGLLEITVSGFS